MRQKVLLIMLALMLAPIVVSPVRATPSSAAGLLLHHSLENGTISIDTFYNTDYTNGSWRITDNKNVNIVLRVEAQPNDTVILVEHMHADCVIFSNNSLTVNGLSQDTMDDSVHGEQPGFYVSTTYPYNCVFGIEGYSKFLIDGWMFMFGGYGAGGVTQERLTEDNLVREGAQGSEFMIIFDLLIKPANETYFHTISFMDDFVVYFNGCFQENYGGILDVTTSDFLDESTIYMLLGIALIVALVVIAIGWMKGS